MDFVYIIFGVAISLVAFVVLVFLAGFGFREWNEGEKNIKNNKESHIKTIVIGLVIIFVLLFLYDACNN